MGTTSSTEQKHGGSSGDDWREGFKAFIKGGACREAYMDFNDCIDEGTGLCFSKMMMCMEANSDYYHPIFTVINAAEKAGAESVVSFLPSNLVDEEEEDKFTKAFMEGGGCKESYNAYKDCKDEAEKNSKEEYSAAEDFSKCAGHYRTLFKCFEAHSDYYHPIFSVKNTVAEVMENEFKAFFSKST